MNEIFLIAADYLKGKPIYSPFRRILDLLFNISITSFIYETFYGSYTWFSYNDYKGILSFFVKGGFFIPFSIFLAVYWSTYLISLFSFILLNRYKTIKWTREILNYQLNKETIENRLQLVEEASVHASPFILTKPLMIELMKTLQSKIPPDAFDELKKALKQPKHDIETSFHTAFRCLIATTIYFFSLPQFGIPLFIIAGIVLILAMYILLLAYRFLDILPVLVARMQVETEKYLAAHDSTSQND